MEDHRNQAGPNNIQQFALYPNIIHNWQERPRDYLNDSHSRNDRNGRQQSRGNGHNSQMFSDRHNTYRKQSDRQYSNTQNNRSGFDRGGMSNSSSRQSPRRNREVPGSMGVYYSKIFEFYETVSMGVLTFIQGQQQTPIYVRNSQRLGNPVQDEARYGGEQRLFSDTTRQKFSNDARYYQKPQWQSLSTCACQNPHSLIVVRSGLNSSRSSYFKGNPNVIMKAKSVNYYYNSDSKGHELDYTSRQVFVCGA